MLIIKIEECTADGGHLYDFYNNIEAIEAGEDAIDGGHCTEDTIEKAFEMAQSHFERLPVDIKNLFNN